MTLTKREKQMQRMWHYFVDATSDIIEEEGIEHVTIRKIADKASYNSATIYNYFQELSHLIFFASLGYLKKYIEALPAYMDKGKNSLEKYILSWECFCHHSFLEPQVYNAIFLADLGDRPEEILENYYTIYQSIVFGDMTEDIKTLLHHHNLSKRSRYELNKSITDGYLNKDDANAINERTVLIWQGMLTTILNNRSRLTADEAAHRTMQHIREIIENYRLI
ncbi:TetR family transcriptional regulator [Virgibacillus sp. Bac330]|uniref:TetR family transcriptional regulator n=1 Tax=Virgibacillus sp. Bac330 TaxID=2419841 RepID=UPI00352A87DA